MNLLGNILWIIFGGLILAIEYVFAGLILCCTIIGIPFGLQLLKISVLAICPFGQKSVVKNNGNTGCLYTVLNILWICTGGLAISITHLFFGIILCITIVGIPFGLQHFKLMTIALTPFGRTIE